MCKAITHIDICQYIHVKKGALSDLRSVSVNQIVLILYKAFRLSEIAI